MPPRDYYTNTVADAAAFQRYHAVDDLTDSYDADIGPDIDRDEDGRFAVDAKGYCTMCRGTGSLDNCPGMCSHENCDEWECHQCEGEANRELDGC